MFETQPPLCFNFSNANPQLAIDSFGMLAKSFERRDELNDWFQRYSKNIMQCKVLPKEVLSKKCEILEKFVFSNLRS
jgi:hypothetical protein